jgi:cyanophycinase
MGRAFLIGGGWAEGAAEVVYGPFVRAAGERGVVGCLVLDEGEGHGAEQFARYEGVLKRVGDCVPVPLNVPLGEKFDIGELERVDALLVCGGLTPAYQDALGGVLDEVPRVLRERGIPYAGFSAGAALAARRAVVGGWLSDGVPVCPEDTGEDLEEIDVRAGLGLVPFGVDVHAAQWGTLPRLIEAVARGRVPYGVALDENTLLDVELGESGDDGAAAVHGDVRVSGLGRVHVVRPDTRGAAGDGGVLVRSYRAGEAFSAAG